MIAENPFTQGFRNIAVHDDQSVTPTILGLVLRDHLNDFSEFLMALEHKWPFLLPSVGEGAPKGRMRGGSPL